MQNADESVPVVAPEDVLLLQQPTLLLGLIKPQQQLLSKSLIAIAGQAGAQLLEVLPQVIEEVKQNNKNSLIRSVAPMLSTLKSHPNWRESLRTVLVPTMLDLFSRQTKNPVLLRELADLVLQLQEEDRGATVIRALIEMGQGEAEMKAAAAQIFGKLSVCFGTQLCEQFVLPQLLSLGHDSEQTVRMAVFQALPALAKAVSTHALRDKLFPFLFGRQTSTLLKLVQSQAVIQLCELAPPGQLQPLQDLMLQLLSDKRSDVVVQAYQSLGRLLYKQSARISQQLLQKYLDLAHLNEATQYYFVYFMPALLGQYGSQLWPLLQTDYFLIANGSNDRARLSIASSLAAVAKLVPKESTTELLATLGGFLRSKNLQVRMAALRQVAGLLTIAKVGRKDQILEVLFVQQRQIRQWRVRESILDQMDLLIGAFSREQNFAYVTPVLLRLCSDEASLVRQKACSKVALLAQNFTGSQYYLTALNDFIVAFAESRFALQRQCFILIFRGLALKKQCAQSVLVLADRFNSLAADPQVSVRIQLAGAVREIAGRDKQSLGLLKRGIESLSSDQDKTVRQVLGQPVDARIIN